MGDNFQRLRSDIDTSCYSAKCHNLDCKNCSGNRGHRSNLKKCEHDCHSGEKRY